MCPSLYETSFVSSEWEVCAGETSCTLSLDINKKNSMGGVNITPRHDVVSELISDFFIVLR